MNDQEVRKLALKYLTIRPRSIYEMETYLNKKKCNETIISEVIRYLKELGYLNDANFCQLWVEDRLKFKPMGKRRLYHELMQKGVAPELIEDTLSQKVSEEIELNLAVELAGKYLRTNDHRQYEKLFRFLVRRGFEPKVAFQVTEEIFS
ncbi:MAG: regulatory protein RecX [Peptococcaceae bacterium]